MIASLAEFRVNKTLAISIFFLCFIAVYFETLAWMMPSWFSTRGFYSHSPLLMGLVVHLLWRDRHELLASHPETSGLLLSGLFFTSFLWLLAWAANLVAVQILAAYLVLLFGSCCVFGKYSYRVVLPILFLLLFTLQIWQPIQFILQDIATIVVQAALDIIGIAVYVEENFITIPTGTFEIEGGCSGVGFILVSLGLSGYLSILDRHSPFQFIKFLVISGVIALFANWVRILLIILVGYYGGMDQPLVRDHVGFGRIVYAVIFFPYLFFITRFSPKVEILSSPGNGKPVGVSSMLFLLILILGFATPMAHTILERTAESRTTDFYNPPEVAGQFERHASTSDWSPSFNSADHTTLAKYTSENLDDLHIFVASYSNQKQGAEVVHVANRLYAKSNKLRDRSTLSTGVNDPSVVTELLLEKPDGTSMGIWYWYKIGGYPIATELDAKIAQIWQKLSGRGDAAIVVFFADCAEPGCEVARQNFLGITKHI